MLLSSGLRRETSNVVRHEEGVVSLVNTSDHILHSLCVNVSFSHFMNYFTAGKDDEPVPRARERLCPL